MTSIFVLNPAAKETFAELPQAGIEEADSAVVRAKAAFPAWRSVAPGDRKADLRHDSEIKNVYYSTEV
jgi:acyl-CoA reductase-like NAD-dependent aldehyde dehydrogenase